MSDDSDLYRIDGSKVWLSATAREMARGYGLTDREFAQYLRTRQRLGDDYQAEAIEQQEPLSEPSPAVPDVLPDELPFD